MSHLFSWPKYSFAIFLFSLLAFLIFGSFLSEYQSANTISRIFITFSLLTAVYLLSHEKMHLFASIVLAIPVISVNWASIFFSAKMVQNISMLANLVFFGYIAVMIFLRLFRAKAVVTNTIFAAISLYFLIGLEFGYLFAMVEWMAPGSFNTSISMIRNDLNFDVMDESLFNFMYYSLTTLTTVGYGDIVPITPVARALSNIEAVVGQMYLTILVARLVGMHITNKVVN